VPGTPVGAQRRVSPGGGSERSDEGDRRSPTCKTTASNAGEDYITIMVLR
jgi:hypothetical protein